MGWLGAPQGPPSLSLDAPRKLYDAAILLRKPRAELVRHALDRRIAWSRESIRLQEGLQSGKLRPAQLFSAWTKGKAF